MPRKGENIRKRTDGRWEGRYLTINCETGKKQYHSVYARTYRSVKEKLISIKQLQLESPQTVLFEESAETERALEGTAETEKALESTADAVERMKIDGESSETAEDIGIASGTEGTFGWIADMWLHNVRNDCKYSTYVKYRQIYEKHIKEDMGGLEMTIIDSKMIKEIINRQTVSSESLIRSIYCVINQVLTFAQDHHFAVTATVTRNRMVRSVKPVEVMKHAEQVRLFEILYANTDRYKFGIILCLSTGLRLGEICALKWSDIDLNGKLLYVNRTVQRIAAEGNVAKTKLMESEPKSAFSKRVIPLSDEMLRLVQEFQTDGEYVISGNKPTEPRTYQNRFHKLLCEANIPAYNFHILRHTFATNCVDSGVDTKSLSELLGHSSVNITLNRYVHPSVQTKRQHMNTLSAIYGQYLGQQCS